jgi:threonine synthase
MRALYNLNENIKYMECIKCSTAFTVNDYFKGCPNCLKQGEPSSISFSYKSVHIKREEIRLNRYTEMLPFINFPTIGEGGTPNIRINKLGEELGLKDLWIKNEGQNPTGSHKDRMSPFVIARAKSIGMKTVAVASSGNAGTSVAAYAAADNMECVVLTTEKINPIWKQAIEKTGAKIIYKKEAMERWNHMQRMVEKGEWYPATNFMSPPVGSNPFGVQGYKTIAYEIIEDFEEIPNIIFIPCSRGDMLWGIWKGFEEAVGAGFINNIPKLIGVEPFPRLKKVVEGQPYINSFMGDSTYTPSVGGTTVTYQALQAIQESKGGVISVPSYQSEKEQKQLGSYGVYVERSSALVLGALKYLIKKQAVNKEDKVLLIISSNGYKELL